MYLEALPLYNLLFILVVQAVHSFRDCIIRSLQPKIAVPLDLFPVFYFSGHQCPWPDQAVQCSHQNARNTCPTCQDATYLPVVIHLKTKFYEAQGHFQCRKLWSIILVKDCFSFSLSPLRTNFRVTWFI